MVIGEVSLSMRRGAVRCAARRIFGENEAEASRCGDHRSVVEYGRGELRCGAQESVEIVLVEVSLSKKRGAMRCSARRSVIENKTRSVEMWYSPKRLRARDEECRDVMLVEASRWCCVEVSLSTRRGTLSYASCRSVVERKARRT